MSSVDLLKHGTLQELHCHTTFCDGRNTPEEMVLAAIAKGLKRIGFSGHSPSPLDEDYAMKPEAINEYIATIHALRDRYADRIEVLCGIEQDVYSPPPPTGLDYVIGSVHYIKVGQSYMTVDVSAEQLRQGCTAHFGGDAYAMCEAYFAAYEHLAYVKPDIIGHMDLITKFLEQDALFDPNHPRYLAAAFDAVDMLIPTGALFEINTGALSRLYRCTPYPSPAILDYIRSRGGKFVLTSDAHRAENLCFGFDEWSQLL
jgi:histidinol-phosphatase (PHP family)